MSQIEKDILIHYCVRMIRKTEIPERINYYTNQIKILKGEN